MRFKFAKNIILIFTVMQLIFAPVYFAYAQTDPAGTSDIPETALGADVNTDGEAATVGKLAGTFGGFKSLIGCKSSEARAMGGALGAANTLFKKTDTGKKVTAKVDKFVNKKTGGLVGGSSDAVPVADSALAKTADDIKKADDDIKKLAEGEKVRNECLNGLAYRLAKYALGKLTQKTVDWINSGFNGDSFFIKDQGSYMKSIVKNQLNSILGPTGVGSFSNSKDYPYGREFVRSFAENRIHNYENYSKSDMYKYLQGGYYWDEKQKKEVYRSGQMTPKQYSTNFMAGGWDGWVGLTQNPANNPLGFNTMTSQEITDRSAKAAQETLNELNWGNGFLSQKKCVKPDDYTLKGAAKNPCLAWKTVTPGSAINDQLKITLGTSQRQLEMADSMNESMSLIFDALINQAMVYGVSQLTTRKDPAFATSGGPGLNRVYDNLGMDITNPTTAKDAQGNPLPASPEVRGWYDQDSEKPFDITGLYGGSNTLSAVISTQLNYLNQLKVSAIPLPQIVPKIAELDYCIPGPNPGWETDVSTKISEEDAISAQIAANGIDSIKDVKMSIMPDWWEKLNTVPVIGEVTGLVGGLVDFFRDMGYHGSYHETPEETQTRLNIIIEAESTLQQDLAEYAAAFQPGVTQQELANYKAKIADVYGENLYEKNIPVAKTANTLISNLGGYQENIPQAISDYNDEIKQTDSNIAQLKEIQKKVKAITDQKYVQDQIRMCALPNNGGVYFGGFSPVGSGVLPGGGNGGVWNGGVYVNGGGVVTFP